METTPTPQAALLSALTSSPDLSKSNYSMIERELLHDSPITIVTAKKENGEQVHFAALGLNRLTKHYATKEILLEKLMEKNYDFLVILIQAITQITCQDILNEKLQAYKDAAQSYINETLKH